MQKVVNQTLPAVSAVPTGTVPKSFGLTDHRSCGAQPSRNNQAINQIAGLISIKAVPQGVAANILEGNLGQAIGLNPPQGATDMLVTVRESDLAQRGARVWPKIFVISLMAFAIESSVTSSGSMAALIMSRSVILDETSRELAQFK